MTEYYRMTPRQQEALDHLRTFWGEHGRGPTLAELGEIVGASPSGIHRLLSALEDAGAVRALGQEQQSRRWVPVGDGQAATKPKPTT